MSRVGTMMRDRHICPRNSLTLQSPLAVSSIFYYDIHLARTFFVYQNPSINRRFRSIIEHTSLAVRCSWQAVAGFNSAFAVFSSVVSVTRSVYGLRHYSIVEALS